MVFEVDEAGCLEAVEDLFGGFLFFAGAAGEEEGEVDELCKGLVRWLKFGLWTGKLILTGMKMLPLSTAPVVGAIFENQNR